MLVVIELHKHDFGVSVEKDLLVDTSNAFNRANIGGILCAQIARQVWSALDPVGIGYYVPMLLERVQGAGSINTAYIEHLYATFRTHLS